MRMKEDMNILLATGFTLFIALSLLQMHGCSNGGGTGSTGQLSVYLTDRNSDDFKELWLSIKEVRAVSTAMGNAQDDDPGLPVIANFDPPRRLDIMRLRFIQEILGTATVPAGSYIQIRLVLEQNSDQSEPVNYIVLKSDPEVRIPLDTPSGQSSGVKVLGKFTVNEGVINAIMIDFDPNTAVVNAGNSGKYNLKPTGIRIVQLENVLPYYGRISGTVSAFDNWTSAVISVKKPASAAPIAAGEIFSNFTSGRYEAPFVAFVPYTATYKVYADATRHGFDMYSSQPVFVNATSATDVGTIQLTK